jgi:hypothetical protein
VKKKTILNQNKGVSNKIYSVPACMTHFSIPFTKQITKFVIRQNTKNASVKIIYNLVKEDLREYKSSKQRIAISL